MEVDPADVLSRDLDMATPRFALSPLDWSDVSDLFAHFSDPRVIEFLDIDVLTDREEAEGIIAWARTSRAEACTASVSCGPSVQHALRIRSA